MERFTITIEGEATTDDVFDGVVSELAEAIGAIVSFIPLGNVIVTSQVVGEPRIQHQPEYRS